MKSLAWIEKLVLVLSLGLLIGAAGCSSETTVGSTPDSGASDQSESGASAALAKSSAVPSTLTARSLTGAWLGGAILDQEKFQKKVAQLSRESQTLATAKAESFLSTAMAMEFHENGTVENEVEVLSTQGQLLRDGSLASWRVLESKPNGLLVQTQERLPNGTMVSDQLFYQFSGDRNQIAIKIPVSQELQDCDAMIVFERQSLPPTNVAAGPTGTLTK